jgi:hypothetical protein
MEMLRTQFPLPRKFDTRLLTARVVDNPKTVLTSWGFTSENFSSRALA